MKIYTRTGDQGRTSLFGGRRVTKHHLRLEAYGTLDELNAVLGWYRARCGDPDLADTVLDIQSRLFDVGAHLATPSSAMKAKKHLPPIGEEQVARLEREIDRLETELPPLTSFVIPGGNEEASLLHVARAVCRRAERSVVRMKSFDTLNKTIVPYLNRLSDLLFVMARVAVHRRGDAEIPWIPARRGEGD